MFKIFLLLSLSSLIFTQVSLEPSQTQWLFINSADFFFLSDYEVLISNNQIFVYDQSQSSDPSSEAIFLYEGPGNCLGNQNNEFFCISQAQNKNGPEVIITKMNIIDNEVEDTFAFSFSASGNPIMINNDLLFQSSNEGQTSINIFDTTTQEFYCSIQTSLSSFIQSELSDSIVLLQTSCQQCQLVQTSCFGHSSVTSQLNFPFGQITFESLLFPLSSGNNQVLIIFPFASNQSAVTSNGFYIYNSSAVSNYILLNNTLLYIFQSSPTNIVTITQEFQILQFQFDFQLNMFQQVGSTLTLPTVLSATFSNNILLVAIKGNQGFLNLQINIVDMSIIDNSISSFDLQFSNGSSLFFVEGQSSSYLATITSDNIYFSSTDSLALLMQNYLPNPQIVYALEIFTSSCNLLQINLAQNIINSFDIAGCNQQVKNSFIAAVFDLNGVIYFALALPNSLQIYNTQQFLLQTISLTSQETSDSPSFFFSSDASSVIAFLETSQITYDISTGLISNTVPVPSQYQVFEKFSENFLFASGVNVNNDQLMIWVLNPFSLDVVQTFQVENSPVNNAAGLQIIYPLMNSEQSKVDAFIFATNEQPNITLVDFESNVVQTELTFGSLIPIGNGDLVQCDQDFKFVVSCTHLQVIVPKTSSRVGVIVVIIVIILLIAGVGFWICIKKWEKIKKFFERMKPERSASEECGLRKESALQEIERPSLEKELLKADD